MNKRLFFVIAISLCSCTQILLKMYGYHSPREETIESYKKYCWSQQMDSSNLVFFKDSTCFMNYYSKKERELIFLNVGVPELYVFNSSGVLLKYKPDSACNAPGFDFTEKACSIYQNLPKTEVNFKDFIKYFRFSNGQEMDDDCNEYDLTIVISWAKFMGKLNKDHVKVWEDNLKAQSSCRVRIIKASLDPIKGMNLKLETKVK